MSTLAGPAEQRLVLPGFPLVLAEELLGQRARVSETEVIRRFAQHVA